MDSGRRADARTAAAVLGIAAGTCATLLYGAYNKVLEPIAHVLVITSVIAVPAGYLLRRRVEKESDLEAARRMIRAATSDAREELGGGSGAELKHIIIEKDENRHEIKFRLVHVGQSGFDSVIHSGHFGLFPPDLQRRLDAIRLRIELNNKLMDVQLELASSCAIWDIDLNGDRYLEVMFGVWIRLTRVQKELLEKIDAVESCL